MLKLIPVFHSCSLCLLNKQCLCCQPEVLLQCKLEVLQFQHEKTHFDPLDVTDVGELRSLNRLKAEQICPEIRGQVGNAAVESHLNRRETLGSRLRSRLFEGNACYKIVISFL